MFPFPFALFSKPGTLSQIYKFRVGRERVFYGSFLTHFVPRPAQFYCVTRGLTMLSPLGVFVLIHGGSVLVCLPVCGFVSGNRARPLRRAPCPSFDPLGVYIYAVGVESCAILLALKGSARLRPKTKPRSAPSGAGQTSHAFVSPFGEKRDSSRALHPPSAARYFVGGIPPSRLARVLWRITRTVVAPFPCAPL